MPIVRTYGAPATMIADAARAGGAAVAQRENMQQGAQLAQRDQQFYAGMANEQAQRDSYAAQRAADNAARLEAERIQGQQAMAELDRRNELERSNVEWKLTKEQEQKQKQYQKELDLVGELEREGEFDPGQARTARFRINEKLLGIEPLPQPKVNPFEQYHVHATPDGKKYYAVPGRNGAPEWKPADPTELDPKTAAKKDSDNEKLKQAEDKALRDAKFEKQKFDLERKKLAADLYKQLTTPVDTGADLPKPLMSPEEAMRASGLEEFIPKAQFNATKRPPNVPPNAVFVRSDDDAGFDRLPPGTVAYNEEGNTGVR